MASLSNTSALTRESDIVAVASILCQCTLQKSTPQSKVVANIVNGVHLAITDRLFIYLLSIYHKGRNSKKACACTRYYPKNKKLQKQMYNDETQHYTTNRKKQVRLYTYVHMNFKRICTTNTPMLTA